jgi:alkylhydroperoxidase family enzyme
MPLLPLVPPEHMPREPEESLARQPRTLNVFRVWAHARTLFAPAVRLGNSIMTDIVLPPNLRELCILCVARVEGCHYEWMQHVPVALRVGCRIEQLRALEAADWTCDAFDPQQSVLLELVREAVLQVQVPEDTVVAARQFFSPQEVIEIIWISGYYMTVARMIETARIEIDAPSDVAVPQFSRIRPLV